MGGMRTGFAAVAVACSCSRPRLSAQDYPNRPVRLVVPFPPGGINDIVARVIAQHLGDRLGKQVIVDNRGGAGGVVGDEFVANAPKDGHTLLIVSLATAVNPWLYTLPYDPLKSFAPISMLVAAPNVVTVNPGLPVNTIKEFVALAKAKPGELQYASSGVGTFLHLAGDCSRSPPASTSCIFRSAARVPPDRRGRRPHQCGVRLGDFEHRAYSRRQAEAPRCRQPDAERRLAGRADRGRGRRCRATRRRTGSVSWRPAAHPSRSCSGCIRRFPRSWPRPKCRSCSPPKAPTSSR